MNVLQLISSKNYIVVNKSLIKIIGLEETIVLGELASEYEYWLDKEQVEDGYFYSTIENIEINTSLNEYKQRKVFKALQDKNIVDIKIRGIPAKRYIKINEEQVTELLSIKPLNNLRTSSLKIKELELEKLKGNNNIINNNKINKNKNNNNKNIYIIVEYLNDKINSNYKPTTKSTRDKINARLNEGFTLDDFKKVIDIKYQEWKGTDYEKYLRPETLFGTKFESYLNQPIKKKTLKEISLKELEEMENETHRVY